MSNNAVNDVLQTKNDRSKIPAPQAGIFDSPYYIKRVNAAWYQHISGAIQALTEYTAWAGSESDIGRAIDAIHEFITKDWQVIENCDQVNDCIEGGQFAIDVYRSLYSQDDQAASAQGTMRALEYTQAGGQLSVMRPSAPRSWVSNDPVKNDAYCGAVYFWLAAWREKYKQFVPYMSGIATIGQTIASALAGLADAFETPWLAAIGLGFVSNWFVDSGANYENNLAALNDPAGFDEYACRLQGLLGSESFSFEGYQAAIDLAQAQGGYTNASAQSIADQAKLYLKIDQAFLYLVDLFAQNVSNYAGLGSECECLESLDCTSGAYNIFPTSAPYIQGDDPRVIHNGQFGLGSSGVNVLNISPRGGRFGLTLPRACIGYIQYSRKMYGAQTSGTLQANIYVDGALTKTVTLSNTSTTALETVYIHADSLWHPTSTIEIQLFTSGLAGGVLEVDDLRVNIRG